MTDGTSSRVISCGQRKAQIVTHEVVDVVSKGVKVGERILSQTRHLVNKGGQWRDNDGNVWNLPGLK